VFGQLEAREDKICSILPYVKRGLLVTKERCPAVLRHAPEQATPASVMNAFEVTGLRHALEQATSASVMNAFDVTGL